MVFCSTPSNNIFIIAMSLFQGQMEKNFQTDRQTTVKLAVIYWNFFGEKVESIAVNWPNTKSQQLITRKSP